MNSCEHFIPIMHMYLDGEADEAQQEALLAHVSVCPRCNALLGSYTAIAQASRLPAEPVPPGLHSSIMAAIAAQGAVKKPRRFFRRATAITAAAAMLAIVLAGSALWPKYSGQSALRADMSDYGTAENASIAGGASLTEAASSPPQAMPPLKNMMMSINGEINSDAVEYDSPAEEGYAAYYLAVGEGEIPEILPEYGEVLESQGGLLVVIRNDQAAIDYAAIVLADAGFVLYGNVTNAPQPVADADESLIVVERP